MDRDRWGPEGPPPEAYARVTNPERFQPLHTFAEGLAARLEAAFDVERTEGYGMDVDLERPGIARPTIRLTPRNPRAAPVVFAFTAFPGVVTRSGQRQVDAFPSCGRFREAIDVPLWGAARHHTELWSADGSRQASGIRLERAEARRRRSEAHREAFDWEAWPSAPGPRHVNPSP
jgi:hypothetical protein